MSSFYNVPVKKIVRETHNSVSVTFDIPPSLKDRFIFIPGQYITIQALLRDEQIRRDYSICSSLQSGDIRIGIKAVEGGLFSRYAVNALKEGDELEISAPQGRFMLQPDKSNKQSYMAFAAGSGITPILSMITSVLEMESESNFVLTYSNKTQEDAMFKAEIDDLQQQYGDRFFVHYTYTQATYEDNRSSRIDAEFTKELLEEYKDFDFNGFFLCGPEPMIHMVKDTLIEQDVDENGIHFELFTSSSEPTAEIEENLDGETEITILLDDEEETFSMKKEHTILDAALLKGLDAPYSCQGGICSSCIAKITEGKAVMEKNSILSDAEVDDGIILTCQAHPTTSKIRVDYDDV